LLGGAPNNKKTGKVGGRNMSHPGKGGQRVNGREWGVVERFITIGQDAGQYKDSTVKVTGEP